MYPFENGYRYVSDMEFRRLADGVRARDMKAVQSALDARAPLTITSDPIVCVRVCAQPNQPSSIAAISCVLFDIVCALQRVVSCDHSQVL